MLPTGCEAADGAAKMVYVREAKKRAANLVSYAPRVNPRNIAERRVNIAL